MRTMFYGLVLFAVLVQTVYGHLNSQFDVPDLVNEINNHAGTWKVSSYNLTCCTRNFKVMEVRNLSLE